MNNPASTRRLLPNGITRDVLERDALRDALAEAHPDVPMLSDTRLRASVADTLAKRPATAKNGKAYVWVFGYGSLIWNPCVSVAEWCDAHLYGFHRDFRIRLTHGRGTPEAPALMLGLVPGGSCRGMALRIGAADLEHELLMIWRREMLTGVYRPRWVMLHGVDQRLPAITFVVNKRHQNFCDRMPDAVVIDMLATGRGLIGSAAEYLNNTVDYLDQWGIHDRRLRSLRARVNAEVDRRRAAD